MTTSSQSVQAIIFDFSGVILYSGYPFLEHFRLNTELLDFIKTIKMPRYIFTSGYIQDAEAIRPALNQIFETIFSADRLGIHKSDPGAYTAICREIGIKPQRALFIDDASSNLAAAHEAGLQTHLFVGNQDLFGYLRNRF